MKYSYYKECLKGKTIYKRFPKTKYVCDKKNNDENFTYYNFWYGMKNFRVSEFIKSRNISVKKIDFISVFGPKNLVKFLKNKKIFFTAEDIGKGSINGYLDYDDYLLNDVDLSIGFREYSDKNYIRFPSWITSFLEPNDKYDDIKIKIERINNRENIYREKFCTLIARHDKSGEREKVYKSLLQYGYIDCPSSFLHNLDANLPDCYSKRKFMEDYRFNICMENHSVKGYVTEKLVDTLRSKCIPIYNGIFTDFEKEIFNEDSIINTLDQNWLKQVEYLNSSNNYKNFISIKPFKKNAALILGKKLDELESKLREILD